MKLIADSGSTKTDWMLLGEELLNPILVHTQGLNPVHMTDEQMECILTSELLPQLAGFGQRIDEVVFYGAGVRVDMEARMVRVVTKALCTVLTRENRVEAHSDLLAAARALFGRDEGIACILGTGANSCLYDGRLILANTPALGYVLGDEGSGAVLGRLFLNALFKGRLPKVLVDEFQTWSGMTLSEVIDRVYRQPLANRWLASLAPFVGEHLNIESVRLLVVENFMAFFRNNIDPYGRTDLPVAAVGGMAFHFDECLSEAARACGYRMGKVLQSPIDGLAAYHSIQ